MTTVDDIIVYTFAAAMYVVIGLGATLLALAIAYGEMFNIPLAIAIGAIWGIIVCDFYRFHLKFIAGLI